MGAVAQLWNDQGPAGLGRRDRRPAAVLDEKGQAEKDPNVCAKTSRSCHTLSKSIPRPRGSAYGFAYVVRPKASNPVAVKHLIAKNPKVEIDQKNCDFVPHSIAMHQDQTLVMQSSDPIGHNVRLSGFTNPGINQVIAPNGQLDVKLVAERLPMTVAVIFTPGCTAMS